MRKEGFIPKESIRAQARAPFTEPAKGVQIRLGILTSLTSQARNAGHTPSEAFNLSLLASGKKIIQSEETASKQERPTHNKLNTNGWREIASKRMLTREEFKSLSLEEQKEYFFSNMNI